jgi:hypothetical protein
LNINLNDSKATIQEKRRPIIDNKLTFAVTHLGALDSINILNASDKSNAGMRFKKTEPNIS